MTDLQELLWVSVGDALEKVRPETRTSASSNRVAEHEPFERITPIRLPINDIKDFLGVSRQDGLGRGRRGGWCKFKMCCSNCAVQEA
jgi:hypothetical protein